MLRNLPTDAVGLPGLAAIMLGFFVFFIALVAARSRSSRGEPEQVERKASITWLWIVIQGVAIGITGFGIIRVELDPMSLKALAEAGVVLLLMAGAVGLFDASSRAMGKNWALVARTRADHTLVETGPFAYIRHPIYVALFLFMLAMAVAFGHIANLILGVPIYVLATAMRIRHEERLLKEQFGTAYDDYAARVKRVIPGVI